MRYSTKNLWGHVTVPIIWRAGNPIYKGKSINKFSKFFEKCVLIKQSTSNIWKERRRNTLIFYIVAEMIYAFIPPRDEILNCVKPNFTSNIVYLFCHLVLHFFIWMEHAAWECDFQIQNTSGHVRTSKHCNFPVSWNQSPFAVHQSTHKLSYSLFIKHTYLLILNWWRCFLTT